MARYAKFFSLGGGGGGTNNLQLPVGTILDTTLRQVQDGLGTGSPLYISTRRVGITSDSSVTTQTSSVIQATTTNANLVIAPNGTGALVAQIPDGTVTGGNARGANAVDLQMVRDANIKVAASPYSVITGGFWNGIDVNSAYSVISAGNRNRIDNSGSAVLVGGASNYVNGGSGFNHVIVGGTSNTVLGGNGNTFIGGGASNTVSGGWGVITGGSTNTVSSNYSTISGGQSNTASTNTHATVVGGQGNTSSGQYSISGGTSNTAGGSRAIALGDSNNASAYGAVCIGLSNAGTGQYSFSIGYRSTSYLESQFSLASDRFSAAGDAQQSLLTARREASLTTAATTVLSLDGTGTAKLIIPNGNNRAWNVQVRWVAVVTAITGTATGVTVGDTKVSTDLLAVAKRAGTTTVGAHTSAGTSVIETTAGSLTTVNITYSAGASQEMAITFTGPTFLGGGSVTMRVVAAISLTEVAY